MLLGPGRSGVEVSSSFCGVELREKERPLIETHSLILPPRRTFAPRERTFLPPRRTFAAMRRMVDGIALMPVSFIFVIEVSKSFLMFVEILEQEVA